MVNPEDIVTKSKFSDLFGCARITLDRYIKKGFVSKDFITSDGVRLQVTWDALVANGIVPKNDPPWKEVEEPEDFDFENPESLNPPKTADSLESDIREMLGSIGVDGQPITITAELGSKAYFEAMKEYWLALKTRQAYMREEGKLIDRDENSRSWGQAGRILKQALDNVPEKWPGILAAETDEFQTRLLLEQMVEEIYTALQHQRSQLNIEDETA